MSFAEVELASLLVGAVTLAAFVLRVSQLHQSLFGDEVLAYHDVVGHSLGAVIRHVRTGVESSPPLFFILAWLSAKLGDPTVWIRLPSLLLGTATIPVIYQLGRIALGRTPGAIGAVVFAASPFSLYYGIEARPYAAMAFFCALSSYLLIRAVRSGGWGWWAGYAIAIAAAAYTHYTAIFLLAVQGAWGLWVCRGRLQRPLAALGGAFLVYLPWLPEVHGSKLGVYALLEPLTLHNAARDLARLIPGYPYAPLAAIPTHAGLFAIAACALLGLVAAGRRLQRSWPPQQREQPGGPALLAALALATPVGVFLYSKLGTDIWDARDLFASAPAAALVLGALLAAAPKRLRALPILGVVAILLFGTIRAISPSWARPPYRSAAHYLDRVAGPRDPIVMYSWTLVLDQAIPVQLKRSHVVVRGAPTRWPESPPGGSIYAVIDDAVLKLGTPHPEGLRIFTRKDFRGLVSFTVLGYRRS